MLFYRFDSLFELYLEIDIVDGIDIILAYVFICDFLLIYTVALGFGIRGKNYFFFASTFLDYISLFFLYLPVVLHDFCLGTYL